MISEKLKNLDNLNSINFETIFTKTSSDYKFEISMLAVCCSFFISFLLITFCYVSALELIQIQLITFLGIYLFFINFKNLFIKVLPKNYKNQIASKNAQNQFYNLKQNTKKQNIMFFISFEEKYIEIITDDEISKNIPNSHWQNIIDEFVISIKENQLLSGYEKAILACNSILIEKFSSNESETK